MVEAKPSSDGGSGGGAAGLGASEVCLSACVGSKIGNGSGWLAVSGFILSTAQESLSIFEKEDSFFRVAKRGLLFKGSKNLVQKFLR